MLFDIFQGLDFVVDGGVRVADPSTVVDMTGKYPTIIRQGKVCGYRNLKLKALPPSVSYTMVILMSLLSFCAHIIN